jgi:hypothetical protein
MTRTRYGTPSLKPDTEAVYTELNLSASDIVRYMEGGATLYKAAGKSRAELHVPDKGVVNLPESAIDVLIEQHQIGASRGCSNRLFPPNELSIAQRSETKGLLPRWATQSVRDCPNVAGHRAHLMQDDFGEQ